MMMEKKGSPTHKLIYCQVEFYPFKSKMKQMTLQ